MSLVYLIISLFSLNSNHGSQSFSKYSARIKPILELPLTLRCGLPHHTPADSLINPRAFLKHRPEEIYPTHIYGKIWEKMPYYDFIIYTTEENKFHPWLYVHETNGKVASK